MTIAPQDRSPPHRSSRENQMAIKPQNLPDRIALCPDFDEVALVESPINRFKVGTDTQGLKHAPDGSITIPIQAEKPIGDAAVNWLPSPKGDFYVILRLYQPSEEIPNN